MHVTQECEFPEENLAHYFGIQALEVNNTYGNNNRYAQDLNGQPLTKFRLILSTILAHTHVRSNSILSDNQYFPHMLSYQLDFIQYLLGDYK